MTQSELDREIEKLEKKYKDAVKYDESEKKIKELRQKLVRYKYRHQLAIADNAAQSAKRGLASLGKSLASGLKAIQDYERRCEQRERQARKKK